ncbi:patatin-like phospholipase family protein [Piscinibacter sp. XHJ-5]|uniref:patatin-like phospholipase family protein n=1 Tax=Piscinibacter sp. XHJ-5 TaxID=3037797 RepID=UPI002452F11A|nr:patatin-like phospholipase family protein [Piscinibacter sp. XHJ-5]
MTQPTRCAARAAALVALLQIGQPASAQDAPRAPRVGLALSGGGARGAAHVGVLKVLEELRVPVHCVAGTSMGAVVGGGFAAGNTPQAMQQLIEQTDWTDVFSDHPPRGELSIRRKADDYKGLFAPEFGLRDGGIQLPRGVVAGVTIESFLRRLAAPAGGQSDFARLPIPYRAVAADIETGREVVLATGSLMQAMRASMAIPGAVSPVEVDGRMLVDGGIANNLPIEVLRRSCADVVIAVNVGTPVLRRENITSALSIVGQLVNLLGKDSVDRQVATLTDRDVLITPDLADISAGSFERQSEAIRIGERAAREAAQALQRYSVPEREYAELRRLQTGGSPALGTVDAIRFEGLSRTNPEVLANLMESKPGEPLDEARLAADLRRVFGRGDFEAVDYRIESVPAGRTLVIPVREKSTGPGYLRFGLGLASDFRDEALFDLRLSYRRTWINRAGGEWLAEAQIGRTNGVFTEFYQPLERGGRFFVAPYLQGAQGTRAIYQGEDRIAEYQVSEWRAGVDFGIAFGTWGELRGGPLVKLVNADVSTGAPVLPSLDTRIAGVRLQLFGDRHDFAWFPRSGHRTNVSAFFSTDVSGSQDQYRRVDASWSMAHSLGPYTLASAVAGGGGLGTRLPAHEAFSLGGPFRLSGYRIGQFSGERFGLGVLRFYDRALRLPTLLGSGTYVGASGEVGRVDRVFGGPATTGTLWSGSVFVAAETFLGPAFFGFGFAASGHRSLYLLLGVP